MQSDRVVKNLRTETRIRESNAYVLFSWDGTEAKIVEFSEIESEDELERFALAVAKEGSHYLRRILKHRLEKK